MIVASVHITPPSLPGSMLTLSTTSSLCTCCLLVDMQVEHDELITRVLRHIKQEAGRAAAAAAGEVSAAGAAAAGELPAAGAGSSHQQVLLPVQQQPQQQHLGLQLGSKALQVMEGLERQELAGLPDQEQLEFYVLADMAFDSAVLVQLYKAHVCSYVAQVHMGRTMRNQSVTGYIRESVRATVMPGRVQQHHPDLASPLAELAGQVPELQATGSCNKLSKTHVVQQTAAAERLLLCLRCLDKWDQHVHLGRAAIAVAAVAAGSKSRLRGQQEQVEGEVAEVIDLAQADTDQELTHQLLASHEDVLLVCEKLPEQHWRGLRRHNKPTLQFSRDAYGVARVKLENSSTTPSLGSKFGPYMCRRRR